MLFFYQAAFAQKDSSVMVPNHLWLLNSKMEIVSSITDSITKDYFNAKWVSLKSDLPITNEAKFICIFQPINGKPDYAYFFADTSISADVINYIREMDKGCLVSFCVQQRNEELEITENRIVSFILK